VVELETRFFLQFEARNAQFWGEFDKILGLMSKTEFLSLAPWFNVVVPTGESTEIIGQN
jgi:hypothetical protein